MTRALRALAVAIALVVPLAPQAAMAHSQLEDTTPQANSTVRQPLRSVELVFNEEVSLPRIVVRSSKKTVITGSMVRRGDSERATFIASKPLPRGNYSVQWRARSADGHWVSGTFAFTVG